MFYKFVKIIVATNNFHMLTFNLRAVLNARNIENHYTFLVRAGFAPHTATSMLNNKSGTVKLKNLELFCKLLHCTPNDLLVWSSDKNSAIPDNHPLHQLKNKKIGFNIKETIRTIPLDQLAQLAEMLKNQENKNGVQ
jgi:DNA-binding Xre family transcriptional regulator